MSAYGPDWADADLSSSELQARDMLLASTGARPSRFGPAFDTTLAVYESYRCVVVESWTELTLFSQEVLLRYCLGCNDMRLR